MSLCTTRYYQERSGEAIAKKLIFTMKIASLRLYALRVFMPFGYLCPSGIYAPWVRDDSGI
jgi:hypothetical protein